MPPTEIALKTTFARFTANYPASFPDDQAAAGVMALWAELLAAQPWVDDVILRRAVTQLLLHEAKRFLPNMARCLEYLIAARDDLEREARAERARLPPPEPVVGGRPSNAALLRHIAIGKLRARHTNTEHSWLLSDNGFQPDSHPFTEDEINAVLVEMERRRQYESLRTLPEEASALDTLAALGMPPVAPVAGEWPQVVAHHGTNGDTR
jgi:hypothetical protein